MLYEAVRAISNVPVIHLSRMMCQQHIMNRIEEIRGKLSPEHCSPVIVISTQLIEAGVDASTLSEGLSRHGWAGLHSSGCRPLQPRGAATSWAGGGLRF